MPTLLGAVQQWLANAFFQERERCGVCPGGSAGSRSHTQLKQLFEGSPVRSALLGWHTMLARAAWVVHNACTRCYSGCIPRAISAWLLFISLLASVCLLARRIALF